MAKITGDKGIVYLNGVEMPQRSSWSVDATREMREARVFNGDSGNSWVENASGFMSWSGSADGYFDSADVGSRLVSYTVEATALQTITLYESRNTLGSYWYGTVWADMSMTNSVDGFTDFNVSLTGSGALLRFPA